MGSAADVRLVVARQPATALEALTADVGEHGAIVEPLDGLAEALDDHPDTIRNATAYILSMEEQPRTALGFLLPSVLGSPATVGSATALKAVASTTNASQLVRLAELLRHCESLVPRPANGHRDHAGTRSRTRPFNL